LPSTSTISGRVIDSSGNGVANVVISATSQSIAGASNLQFSAFTTTDSGGNYSFAVLNGTNYTVSYIPPAPKP
jgi:protocatechuate 3,4-dioxygenase beta subunit